MPITIGFACFVCLAVLLWQFIGFWGVIASAIATSLFSELVWILRKRHYFASEAFGAQKLAMTSVVAKHNEIVEYVAELHKHGRFDIGMSPTGQHAHFAGFKNTSRWNYQRNRITPDYSSRVHNCSLQVVRRASQEPIKYLMKYFKVSADVETLDRIQTVSSDLARVEGAIQNLELREKAIVAKINPPAFILTRYAAEFWAALGAQRTPLKVPYPVYKFQYVSAGGNSGQEARISLDIPFLEKLSETLVAKIRWAKSAAAQRALMTAKLRAEIKTRDKHSCQKCSLSVRDEPNLLLEVDHIIPVSKGGLSVRENLQTLCWRCNRSKAAKMPGSWR